MRQTLGERRAERADGRMIPKLCFVSTRLLKSSRTVVMLISTMPLLASISAAQDVSATADSTQPDRHDVKTYLEQNGTQTLRQTLETEHHVTSDGEVEIQRYRAPAWDGDDRVTWESEVRTRKLPDGTVTKEYVLRNPDGAGHLVPTGITRETITTDGDSTVVQREVLGHLGTEDWQPIQKEQTVERGPSNAKQVKEVQRLDTVDGHWKTTERETSVTSANTVGEKTHMETNSVRQSAEPYGKLRDIERQETTEHLGRESDLLFGNYQRSMESRHPEVVEEQTRTKTTAPDGSRQTVTEISGRTAAAPSTVRPLYTVEESDSAGYARRIYIPAQ